MKNLVCRYCGQHIVPLSWLGSGLYIHAHGGVWCAPEHTGKQYQTVAKLEKTLNGEDAKRKG